MPLVFALTLFLSATLLFLVEPMIAKMILPKFGGTPAVWNTCMVFFQAALLAAYGYAHAVPKWLTTRRLLIVQVVLLCVPFIVLPIAVSENYAPPGDAHPIPYVLFLLLLTVGLPFFVVSTSAPLLQKWFAETGHASANDPYFLYAASNLGSMVALLGYPLLVEPYMALQAQGWIWTIGYAVLVTATAGCAWLVWRSVKLAPVPAFAGVLTVNGAEGISAEADLSSVAAGTVEDEASEAVTATKPESKRDKRGKRDKRDRSAVAEIKRLSSSVTATPPKAREQAAEEPDERPDTLTLGQRLHWVALAFVPSSLMLGVTNYLTTDLTPMPLLWVIPLAIYLLSFILVFSTYGRTFLIAILGGMLLLGSVVGFSLQNEPSALMEFLLGVMFLIGAGMMGVGFLWGRSDLLGKPPPFSFLKGRADKAGHLLLVLLLPVAILLMSFMILSGVRPEKIYNTFLAHLVTLFIVAMVCHGELARTRPSIRHLTEFYLLMSVGGVLGGMFNALLAPLVFTRITEYPLAMLFACLVLPNLGEVKKTRWTRILDIGLPAVMGLLAVGLVVKRWIDNVHALSKIREETPARYLAIVSWIPDVQLDDSIVWIPARKLFYEFASLFSGETSWFFLGVLPLVLASALLYICYSRKDRLERCLDLGVVLALFILAASIIIDPPNVKLPWLAERLHMREARLLYIISFALPALFCYIFVERPVRFGLCVGAYLLAGAIANDLDESPFILHRERSFFGAIKVKRDRRYHELLHGTTLHGQQWYNPDHEMVGCFLAPLMSGQVLEAPVLLSEGVYWWGRSREALTYYHRTGPIGQVFDEFEKSKRKPPYAVIGLGTGTMASYGEPGQKVTYYEIDPAVKRIAEDRNLFTYVTDARGRGVDVKIDIGDARLRMARTDDKPYGLIVVDAFSSDAIPIHLITKEAMQVYLDHLAPDGIVAFHISNRYVNLEPVLVRFAREFNLTILSQSDHVEAPGKSASTWVMLARNPKAFGTLMEDIERWPGDRDRRWDNPLSTEDADQLTKPELAAYVEQHLYRKLDDMDKDEVARWKNIIIHEDLDRLAEKEKKQSAEFEKEKKAIQGLTDAEVKRKVHVATSKPEESITPEEVEKWRKAALESVATREKQQAGEILTERKSLLDPGDGEIRSRLRLKLGSRNSTKTRTEEEVKIIGRLPTDDEVRRLGGNKSDAEVQRAIQNQMDEQRERARAREERAGLWTDDFSNLFSVFNWGN